MGYNMKIYFFTMIQMHFRTEERIARVTGVVSADTEEAAKVKAWELAGSDYRFRVEVEEIDVEKGYYLVVYKSEI